MSWCHRLIAHDWLLSVCRPHPATSSTFVFDQFYGHCASQSLSLSARGTRSSRLSRSRPLYVSFSLSLSLLLHFFFFLRSHGHARRPSRLAPFVLGSMPQLTPGIEKKKKENRTARDRETVSTQGRERRAHGLTDLLLRPRTPRTPEFLFFAFRRPALPTTLSERNPRPSS